MLSTDLINQIETLGKIKLSKKLRNWIKDNTFKYKHKLHVDEKAFVDDKTFFVSELKEIYIHYNIFLQEDAKIRTNLAKVNTSKYALMISKDGLVRLYKPSSN